MSTPTFQQKKKSGHSQSETHWSRGHPNELEDHLANYCKEVSDIVHSFYLGVVSARDFRKEDTISSSNKKRKSQTDQWELTDWFESTNINLQKKASITYVLVRAFVCCEHDSAKKMLTGYNQITSFFKRSHIVEKLLTDAATTLQIGGGLKTYCEMRWTSVYEAVSLVSHLQMALEYVLKNNPNEITNKSVKRNIQSSEFFSNVDKLTRGMVEFHQHCIQSFNKYWAKFDPKIYVLAYFLHPGYCACGLKAEYWKTITTIAAQIWQNNGGDKKSCNRLLAQMRNYELRHSPYNQDFDRQLETPMSWWLTIKNKYDYLLMLAIMVFSITPHSAKCERVFSTLGWLYDAAKYSYNDNENSDDSDNISDNESNGENELDNSKDIEMESNYDIEELIQ
ncbi:hypothetical protein RclHR1_04340016 [Rhizophagus clarus]|uniref:HAT C-terminal dimerisation domain-containing protein n=1 Tax=Rhizophagus clarus TaxID=94130 RepID=A0A2Z6SB59_9GLOM|nr:hypothetical protein RclHR1_04340016 [Rhizophagus clarus]